MCERAYLAERFRLVARVAVGVTAQASLLMNGGTHVQTVGAQGKSAKCTSSISILYRNYVGMARSYVALKLITQAVEV